MQKRAIVSAHAAFSKLSSVPTSVNDPGAYRPISESAASRADTVDIRTILELQFIELSRFLVEYQAKETPNDRTRTSARQKLARLASQHFYDLSTDTYDELVRRQVGDDFLPTSYLPYRDDLHVKRNQGRQTLSILSTSQFEDLCSDVCFELSRRHPEFTKDVPNHSLDEDFGPHFRAVGLWEVKDRVTTQLADVFKSIHCYRQLLACDEVDAQRILDAFQQLLDTENFSDRPQLIAAMRRLSERTKQYPTSFSLIGPMPTADDEPVTYGSFADIYKIVFHGEETCYKVIRVYQRSQVDHLAKVYAREAILWGQLSHPNILPFYGLVKIRSRRLAFVSRWASNGTLEDYLTTHPDVNRVLLCIDTAAGVNYLHENEIVHGDLKGVNVLIDKSGRACLGDFGLSSVYDPKILRWTSQSSMASKGGTTRWKAPELVGSEDVIKKAYNSKATDVYAWASVCYEIFTEQLPFHDALNDATVVLSIVQGQTPGLPPSDHPAWLQHGLNQSIWALMKDCWAFEPIERPEMTTVISRLRQETPPDLRPSGEWAEKEAMRFRKANVSNDILKDPLQFWESLETLLLRLAPGTDEE